MGSDATPEPGTYVNQLADHARRLNREARGAIARGDYAHAAALIGAAELLADDVHGIVDDIEHRQTDWLMRLVAAPPRTARAGARRSRLHLPLPPRRIRAALGAGLAMSLALVEC